MFWVKVFVVIEEVQVLKKNFNLKEKCEVGLFLYEFNLFKVWNVFIFWMVGVWNIWVVLILIFMLISLLIIIDLKRMIRNISIFFLFRYEDDFICINDCYIYGNI